MSQVQSQGSTENLLAEPEFSLMIRRVELYWTQVHGNAVTIAITWPQGDTGEYRALVAAAQVNGDVRLY